MVSLTQTRQWPELIALTISDPVATNFVRVEDFCGATTTGTSTWKGIHCGTHVFQIGEVTHDTTQVSLSKVLR